VQFRVLVVDDQEPFRVAARTVVEMTPGFEMVGEAASGEEAVRAARALGPDLVLMDVVLPGIDGLAATRLITHDDADVCVLLLSTYDMAAFRSQVEASGAAGFLQKGAFGPDVLLELLGSASGG
jgi:DNA-binding NarL/FixJ family response regulator